MRTVSGLGWKTAAARRVIEGGAADAAETGAGIGLDPPAGTASYALWGRWVSAWVGDLVVHVEAPGRKGTCRGCWRQ
jgi:hypothetical protein